MKHFLAVSDYSSQELQDLLDLAIRLKKEYFGGGNPPLLKGKVLGMIFQKPSLRTRVSFDMAMRHLSGTPCTSRRTRSASASAKRLPISPASCPDTFMR